jgi:hypothetical protein
MPLSLSPMPLSPPLPLPCTRHEKCNACVNTCIISSIGASSIIILNYSASSRNRNWLFQVGRSCFCFLRCQTGRWSVEFLF